MLNLIPLTETQRKKTSK
uniref:Uncharacterized protein n=1 Tax=Anguilla anguilla TaxID=7936 RepID=A0A0E9VLK7_ANGAN